MSVEAISWALKQRTGSSTTKHVLIVLANYANSEHACYPSQKLIADQTELSERAIRTALGALEEGGFIRRERRSRDDGSRTSDLIILSVGEAPKTSARVQPAKSAVRSNRQNLPDLPAPRSDSTGTTFRPDEPKGEPSEAIASKRTRAELDRIGEALLEAAGQAVNTTLGTHLDLSSILACLDNGCDLEADVIGTIRAKAARLRPASVRNWSFFTASICEARDRRLASLPVQPVTRPPPGNGRAPPARGGNHFAELLAQMDEHDAQRPSDDHRGLTIDATRADRP